MKISTEIGSASKFIGERKAIELCAKAGFDGWDFTMAEMARWDSKNKCPADTGHPLNGRNYLEFSKELRKIGEYNGIVCNQAHAPTPLYSYYVRGFMERALECAAVAGAKIIVMHPNNYNSPEDNAKIFLNFLPKAKEYGVKIAVENMWDRNHITGVIGPSACSLPYNFLAHLKIVGDEYFVANLDIGHAEIKGCGTSAVEIIRALGNRIQALHIHDNDGLNDSHMPPFSMNIDFEPIVKELKKVGYNGWFTLEASYYLKSLPSQTEESIEEGLRYLASTAEKLADMYEKA